MPEVGVICARASSIEKLEEQLQRLLAGYNADRVVGVSHASTAVSSKQSGGIWNAARETAKVEYSAVVLLRE